MATGRSSSASVPTWLSNGPTESADSMNVSSALMASGDRTLSATPPTRPGRSAQRGVGVEHPPLVAAQVDDHRVAPSGSSARLRANGDVAAVQDASRPRATARDHRRTARRRRPTPRRTGPLRSRSDRPAAPSAVRSTGSAASIVAWTLANSTAAWRTSAVASVSWIRSTAGRSCRMRSPWMLACRSL